jgi:hypothetical protein
MIVSYSSPIGHGWPMGYLMSYTDLPLIDTTDLRIGTCIPREGIT